MVKIDKEIYLELGQQLREAREKKGFSLEYVAERLGVSKKTVQRYELAESRISTDRLKNLSAIVGLDYDKILNSTLFNVISPISERVSFRKLVHEAAKRILDLTTQDMISRLDGILTEEDVHLIEENPDSFDEEKVAEYESILNINLNSTGFQSYEDAWYSNGRIFLGRSNAFSSKDFDNIDDYAHAVANRLIEMDKYNEIEELFENTISLVTTGMNFEQFKAFYESLSEYAQFKSFEIMGARTIWQSKESQTKNGK